VPYSAKRREVMQMRFFIAIFMACMLGLVYTAVPADNLAPDVIYQRAINSGI
jgi:hypothetical protein